MRVLIINTSETTGGAAVAANRLKEALNNNGVQAKMLVRDKQTNDDNIVAIKSSYKTKWNKLWERFCIYYNLNFDKTNLFAIDIANIGTDITSIKEFKEADVIHLSWINQGMLSLNNIKKIILSGKAIVWTMHDLWPASSICHYAHGCEGFHNGCTICPLLPNKNNKLAQRVYNKKKKIIEKGHIHFVSCSNWLAQQAKKSGILTNQFITNIPNPIDTTIFKPLDKIYCRNKLNLPIEKKIILFASQKVTDKRKGMEYFIKAMELLKTSCPETKENIEIALLGGHSEDLIDKLPFKVHNIGYISEASLINIVYNAADTFVLPSLEDNLPNTIMESMACGIPCVGFNVGGIPEMIEHRSTGYIAKAKDYNDLANGIYWILYEADYNSLYKSSLEKVKDCYSQKSVAKKYLDIYKQAIKKTNIIK